MTGRTLAALAGQPREMQRVSKLDPETNELMSLDLIVAGPGLEEV